MVVLNLRCGGLLVALALVSGCGREERAEAVRFCKVLTQKHGDFASANQAESSFFERTRSWCGAIIASGAGRDAQLDKNADMARELAQAAVAASTQLGKVRQSIYDETLTKEYLQGVRSNLIEQFVKRQRFLQDLRALLEDSAPVFLEFRKSKDYTGDSYPGGVGKLSQTLATNKGPDDILAQAIKELREKYSIKDAELGT